MMEENKERLFVSCEEDNCMYKDYCSQWSPAIHYCEMFKAAQEARLDRQPESEIKPLSRADICDIVKQTICGERVNTHGEPEQSFADISTMWSMYTGHAISREDVAVMMILFKICRYMDGKPIMDHLVDIAGYAAIAAEMLSQEGKLHE